MRDNQFVLTLRVTNHEKNLQTRDWTYKEKTNTKKYVAGILSSLTLAVAFAVPAMAAKPANPGCFDTDRAAVLHTMQADTALAYGPTAPGASEWGVIASQRAGDNGQINRDYVCQP